MCVKKLRVVYSNHKNQKNLLFLPSPEIESAASAAECVENSAQKREHKAQTLTTMGKERAEPAELKAIFKSRCSPVMYAKATPHKISLLTGRRQGLEGVGGAVELAAFASLVSPRIQDPPPECTELFVPVPLCSRLFVTVRYCARYWHCAREGLSLYSFLTERQSSQRCCISFHFI